VSTPYRLIATIEKIDVVQLRAGQDLTVLELSVSYLEALQFQQLLQVDRPTIAKRRKHRTAVPPPRELKTWLRLADGSRVEVDAALGMSAPLDAPATLTLLTRPDGLAVGREIEMEINQQEARD
jgi:hypothetical protein